MLNDFISLLFPQICAACGKPLYKTENAVCTFCRYHLPRTGYHLERDNPVSRLFWGKVDVFAATAYYFFRKGDKVQRLIHQLKYNGQQQVGITVGRFMGSELKDNPFFQSIDCLIPVPLHPAKKRRRGYNQSDCIGMGLAGEMGKPCYTDNMYRAVANVSQTRKSQWERFRNVEGIFKLKEPALLRNKHILIVDDVVTTGSTLEACANTLQHLPSTKVSIAAIACTMQ
ncbi:MAG: ComF family protein [Flavobacteriales bacterium]